MKPRCRRVETKRGRELARGLGVLAAQRACLHRRWRLSVQRGSERAYDGGNPPDESNWHPVTHRFHYAGLLAVRPLAGASVGTHRFTRTREGSPDGARATTRRASARASRPYSCTTDPRPGPRPRRPGTRGSHEHARGLVLAPARARPLREGPTSTRSSCCWPHAGARRPRSSPAWLLARELLARSHRRVRE